MAENTTGTALAQVAPGMIARVSGEKPFTVSELADLLAAPAAKLPEAESFPAPPRPVSLTDALKDALRALPRVFGIVVPTERRKLEAAEVRKITDEINAIDALSTEIGTRKKALQEYMRTHMDFTGEADKTVTAGTQRVADGVAKGHWLLAEPGEPYEVPVDGYADCWQQRYVKGGTEVSQALLEKLAAEGKITRSEFLGFTREVRKLDEGNIAAFIRKNPHRGLAILAAITTRSAPSASVYAPRK